MNRFSQISRDSWKVLQRWLTWEGYDAGTADGIPGPKTYTALQKRLDKAGLYAGPIDGKKNPALEKALSDAVAAGLVRRVQPRIVQPVGKRIPWHRNVRVFASARQSQLARMNDGSVYTRELVALAGTMSLEVAHMLLCTRNLHDASQTAVNSNVPAAPWTPSARPDPGRKALLLVGQHLQPAERSNFEKDLRRFQQLLLSAYGLSSNGIAVVRSPTAPSSITARAKAHFKGARLGLLYYTGHGTIDNEAKTDNSTGEVSISEGQEILQNRSARGQEGSDHHAWLTNRTTNRVAFLHENRLKSCLNDIAPTLPGGLSVFVDACYAGSLIASFDALRLNASC